MNPFTDLKDQQVLHWGERKLIRNIARWLGDAHPPAPAGIGDDAAEISPAQGKLIFTKDALVWSKHFDESATPEQVGAKLLKRNLSDLAAMGATPSHALVACLLPPSTSILWLERFFTGLNHCAEAYEVPLVGGDVTSTVRDLAFTLTLLGKAANRSLTRKSAGVGDSLWVTGTLGGSRLSKHLDFSPRLDEGAWLADYPAVTSGMDLSDGLATDLHHLCPESCSIELDTDALPIAEDAETLAGSTGMSPVHHALTDGEDYELLFTLKAEQNPIDFIREWSARFKTELTCIGKVTFRNSTEQPAVIYRGSYSPEGEQGYEHFR